MKISLWIILQLIYVAGIITLLALTGDKYVWMYDMEPSLSAGAIENNNSNSNILSLMLLFGTTAAQAIIFMFYKSKYSKALAIFLALLAVFMFTLK